MKKLIINADDFGYNENVNRGIISAHKNGVVTCTSMFVDMEGTNEAVNLIKENPDLCRGIHVDLDKFFEIDHNRGVVKGPKEPVLPLAEIKNEIIRQVQKMFSFGTNISHLDSHHHSHLHPDVFPVACKICADFKIPVIRLFGRFYISNEEFEKMMVCVKENNLIIVPYFIEGWYWGNIDENYEVAELMTHPGYGEVWREYELANCCQPNFKGNLKSRGIEVIRFRDLLPK